MNHGANNLSNARLQKLAVFNNQVKYIVNSQPFKQILKKTFIWWLSIICSLWVRYSYQP